MLWVAFHRKQKVSVLSSVKLKKTNVNTLRGQTMDKQQTQVQQEEDLQPIEIDTTDVFDAIFSGFTKPTFK